MSDSVWPQRQQPTRLPRPWDSPGKNTGVGCHFLLQYINTLYMEFRKTVTMILYARQQKKHRRTDFWTMWEKARVGWFERIALKHVYYHMQNRWPVQVWCMKQGTQSQCSGTTQRDGVGREVGWKFSMGDTCISMADSCPCMAKTITIYKVIILQLK